MKKMIKTDCSEKRYETDLEKKERVPRFVPERMLAHEKLAKSRQFILL
jgi:hypothetical protein